MKKLLFILALSAISFSAFAGGDWGAGAVSVSKNGAATYLFTLGNANWSKPDGTYNNNTLFPNYDFGTPTSLVLDGATGTAWVDGGDWLDGTSFVLYYRVYKTTNSPGAWSSIPLDFLVYSTGNDRRYDKTGANINLLSLASTAGTYYLEVVMTKKHFWTGGNWNSMIPGGQSTVYNSSASGYKATFTFTDPNAVQGQYTLDSKIIQSIGMTGVSYTFVNNSLNAESYSWQVDGVDAGTANNSLTQTFTTAGNHIVKITATKGLVTSTMEKTIKVFEQSAVSEKIIGGNMTDATKWVMVKLNNTQPTLTWNSANAPTGATTALQIQKVSFPDRFALYQPVYLSAGKKYVFDALVKDILKSTGTDVNLNMQLYISNTVLPTDIVDPFDGGTNDTGNIGQISTWLVPNNFKNIDGSYKASAIKGSAVTGDVCSFIPPTDGEYFVVLRFTSWYSSGFNLSISNLSLKDVYTMSLTAGANGTITSGGGDYYAGATVTTIASPNSGYHFVNWTENGTEVSTSASYTFTASGNRTLVANFASNTVNISTGTNATTLVNCDNCDVTVASGVELTVNANKTFHSVTMAPSAKLTLANGNVLTAPITLQSSISGSATFVDQNTGLTPPAITATVLQYLPQGRNWYLSSPVINGNYDNLAGTGIATSVSYYNEITSTWVNGYTGSLTPGVGYVAVSGSGTETNNAQFSGTLNNGKVEVTLTKQGPTKTGFNLVANPYPSYLNAMDAINSNSNILGTIWYRTQTADKVYKFETVNTSSGIGTNDAATGKVTGYIPPMQAFWVRTNVDGEKLTFTNAMRAHAGNVNTGEGSVPTTPMKAPSETGLSQIVRLQVSNGINSDETIVYTNENALNGYDKFDSPKYSNDNADIPEIYTITNGSNEQMVINGMNKFPLDTEIPLGFTTKTAGSIFTIKANELKNIESNIRMILYDKQNQIQKDLTDGSDYTFSSDISTGTDRFSILFKVPSDITGIDKDKNQQIVISKNANNKITINCEDNLSYENSVTVYNAIGQKLIAGKLNSNPTVLNIPGDLGVYYVTVINGGKKITAKVILN